VFLIGASPYFDAVSIEEKERDVKGMVWYNGRVSGPGTAGER